MEKIFNKRNII